jgi:type VI secretion system lysozyme-like protein
MRKSNTQYLPSLLDRVTDDDYLSRTLATSKRQVELLEKKLLTKGKEASEKDKKSWLSELKSQRGQLTYLQQSTGSLNRITDCVKRDLTWLFNAQNMCMDEELEESYANVASSVLNYGMPDLTGRTASSINIYQLEKALKQTIVRFEPRIIPSTLKVKLHEDKSMMDHNALVFEIDGNIWSDPVPIHLHLLTQMDLENGNIEVTDF